MTIDYINIVTDTGDLLVTDTSDQLVTEQAPVILTGVASVCSVTSVAGDLIAGSVVLTGVASVCSVTSASGTLASGVVLTGVASICSVTAATGVLDTTTQAVILSGVASICSVTSASGTLVLTISPDYMNTLPVTPTRILPKRMSRNAFHHRFEDGRVRTKNLSVTKYDAEFQWDYISAADLETILDWYHDSTKADGMARTFYWDDPRSGETYIARFLGPLKTVFVPGDLQSIDKISVRLIKTE